MKTTTIPAREVRVGDVVRDSGATFTVKSLLRMQEMIVATCVEDTVDQAFRPDRMIEVLGARGRKESPLVHWNQFTPAGTVRVREAAYTMNCGVKPKVAAFTREAELVTCPRCSGYARDAR